MVTRKLSPLLHSIATLPSMLVESAYIPMHRISQERDWKILCDRFPGLDQYSLHEDTIMGTLKPAYTNYISHFSTSLISLSLNRASFLFFFVALIHAKRILDLGSGFSSYVFRLYVNQVGQGEVISVDDSEAWLSETKRFLEKYKLDTTQLCSLQQYAELRERQPLNCLCLLDIGDYELRKKLLLTLITDVHEKDLILIIDDFHVPAYRKFIIALCKARAVQIYSLRKVTRRRLSHMALIIK